MVDAAQILSAYHARHEQASAKLLAACGGEFARVAAACVAAYQAGRKILLCGNGGSAAEAQHIAAELTVKFLTPRRHLAAIALTTDTSAITAAGNDFDFAEIFAVQLRALANPGDVVLAYTTSGHSKNIVRALAVAKELGATTIAFCGHGGGSVEAYADYVLRAPGDLTPHIQEMHNILGHALCIAIEDGLALQPFAASPWSK
jgi:D-sedoheptulose 7-phosphate isomerase